MPGIQFPASFGQEVRDVFMINNYIYKFFDIKLFYKAYLYLTIE